MRLLLLLLLSLPALAQETGRYFAAIWPEGCTRVPRESCWTYAYLPQGWGIEKVPDHPWAYQLLAAAVTNPASQIWTDWRPSEAAARPTMADHTAIALDPIFGTRYWRVTDETDADGDCTTVYSNIPTFNSNGTRLMALCNHYVEGSGWLPRAVFMDWAAGGGVTNRSTVDYLPLRLNWGQSSWSNTNPDLVYAWGGSVLTSYNVRTVAVATVKDFTSVFPGEYVWQLTHSINDDVWAFTRRLSADYSTVGYAVWKASTDTVLYTTKEPIDEVEIDKSGRYLIVKLGDMGGDPSAVEGRIVDLQTGSVRNLTNGAPDFNLGHSGMGTAFQVGGENLAGIDRKRIMAAPWTLTNLIEMPWLGLSHYSMLADDENWVTTYSTDPVPKVFGGEIGQLKTDGSYGVRRFAHHWATISGYGDYPFANISRNGAWVAFGSNWQKTLKGGRKDVYVVTTATVP